MSDPKALAVKLKESRLAVADHKRAVYFAEPEAGTPADALLDPAYWAHVARRIRPLDRIEAVSQDGSWYQELIVLHVGPVAARVARLRLVDLEQVGEDAEDSEEYEIKYKGAVAKHVVIRKSDGMVMKDGIATKVEAMTFLQTLLPKAA